MQHTSRTQLHTAQTKHIQQHLLQIQIMIARHKRLHIHDDAGCPSVPHLPTPILRPVRPSLWMGERWTWRRFIHTLHMYTRNMFTHHHIIVIGRHRSCVYRLMRMFIRPSPHRIYQSSNSALLSIVYVPRVRWFSVNTYSRE